MYQLFPYTTLFRSSCWKPTPTCHASISIRPLRSFCPSLPWCWRQPASLHWPNAASGCTPERQSRPGAVAQRGIFLAFGAFAPCRQRRLTAAFYQLVGDRAGQGRSEEHTSELQSLMRISYAVFCLKKKNNQKHRQTLESEEYNKIS